MRNRVYYAILFSLSVWLILVGYFSDVRFPQYWSAPDRAQHWGNLFADIVLFAWLRDWQTLAAGVLALAAAAITAFYLRKQIGQSELQERARIRRRHFAVRSILPLALSALTDYAEGSAKTLIAVLGHAKGKMIPRGSLVIEVPETPVSAIETLREMIEFSDDYTGSYLASLIAQIQVQRSRLVDLREYLAPSASSRAIVAVVDVEIYIFDAAVIHAVASQFFRYARRATHQPPTMINWDDVAKSLDIISTHMSAVDGVRAFIARAAERGEKPLRFGPDSPD